MIDPAELPLRDLHLPPSVSWWPPAPGWWLVALLVLVVPLALLLYLRWRRLTRVRRAALALWAALPREADCHQLAMHSTQLLRRVLFAFDPSISQQTLTGERWLACLAALAPGLVEKAEWWDLLVEAPYNPAISFDRERWLAALGQWLRRLPARAAVTRHV